jgi:predicted transcriptional regulator
LQYLTRCRKIIISIIEHPKTVQEIYQEVQCSKTRVYRKIRFLKQSKLVKSSGVISKDGRKIFKYQSRITRNQSIILGDGFVVNVILNEAYDNGT